MEQRATRPAGGSNHPKRKVLTAQEAADARQSIRWSKWQPPVRQFAEVTHIGTFDFGERRSDSYEGDGLSVSVDPEDWEYIARLGGNPWWTMERPDGKPLTFVDAHGLTKKQRADIEQWGIARGMVERVQTFEVVIWDECGDVEGYMVFDSEEEALNQLDDPDDEEEISERLRTNSRINFTEAYVREHNPRGASLANSEDVLLTLWAEQNTDADGVWWNDDHDPIGYSAPRGVILPSRVAQMNRRPCEGRPRG